jgi:hypothetical protein
MKMTVFWDTAPCSLVKLTYVSEALTASIIMVFLADPQVDLMIEAANASVTSVSF